MIRKAGIAACWLAALLAIQPAEAFNVSSEPLAAQGTLQAAFSPEDNIEGLITEAIDAARKQVLVQAYLLTSKPIAQALKAALRRGLDVRVLADAEQLSKGKSSQVPELAAAGIPVWLETAYQNAHNKVIVIDAASADATVITGSYNFTWSAQHKNAENVLIARRNPSLAARYALNWERHRSDATPYQK
jgi:phosphatidylserine/phosphatidylglycerophosphate/cardiolipin synthase-like enzyme